MLQAMKQPVVAGLALVCLGSLLPAAAAPEIVREGAMEKRALFTPAEVKAWAPAESTVEVSNERVRAAAVSLHWRVTVDYNAGEAKYPIGWPRLSRALPAGAERDWSGWDFLHCWIYTATSRDRLPSVPAGLGLHTPDRASAYQRTLSELRAGEWVEIKIPLTQIPRHGDVRNIQFHIAESNYRDADRLDFYLSDLALLRYAVPTLLEVVPESPVVFADAARIAVRIHVAGVPTGQRAEVVCALRHEGAVAATTTVAAVRGVQQIALELGAEPLAPGDYELHAHLAGRTAATTARVRLVESPWR
jgi:hypothetical protein